MKIEQTLCYYDGPQLATFRDASGELWMGLCVDDYKFMLVRTTPYLIADAISALHDKGSLRSLFVDQPEYRLLDYMADRVTDYEPKDYDFPLD